MYSTEVLNEEHYRRFALVTSRKRLAGVRIESVAQAITDDIQAQDGNEDEQPWNDRQVRTIGEEQLGVAKHIAPGWGRCQHAEIEEAQRGFGQNQATNTPG